MESEVRMPGSYPLVANADVTPSGAIYVGDAVEITCKQGYQLNDAANSPSTCYDNGSGGSFDKMAGACVAVCAAYPAVAHASVVPAGATIQNQEVC